MVVMGYVYTLGNQTSRFPKRRTSQNATGAGFLEAHVPLCAIVLNWDWCSVSSAGSAQKFGEMNTNMNMKPGANT